MKADWRALAFVSYGVGLGLFFHPLGWVKLLGALIVIAMMSWLSWNGKGRGW